MVDKKRKSGESHDNNFKKKTKEKSKSPVPKSGKVVEDDLMSVSSTYSSDSKDGCDDGSLGVVGVEPSAPSVTVTGLPSSSASENVIVGNTLVSSTSVTAANVPLPHSPCNDNSALLNLNVPPLFSENNTPSSISQGNDNVQSLEPPAANISQNIPSSNNGAIPKTSRPILNSQSLLKIDLLPPSDIPFDTRKLFFNLP